MNTQAATALRELLEQLDGIGIADWHGAEGLDLGAARAAVATPAPAPRPAPDRGRENALAWFASIVEMVDTWRKAQDGPGHPPLPDWDEDSVDTACDRIIESVLSVEVRSDWHDPTDNAAGVYPAAEYNMLLSTGGPALRLVGDLSEHGEPESARLEAQDWGTPWTEITPTDLFLSRWAMAEAYPTSEERERAVAYLLDFARQFYFGE